MASRGTRAKKISGLSRATIRHVFSGSSRHSKVLAAGKQNEHLEEVNHKRQQQLQEMTSAERDMVETMMMDNGFDTDLTPYTALPGEEGLDLSYEGGEHEVFDGLSQHIASLSGCHYLDPRTRHDCIEVQTEHWNTQIDHLVNEYLDYRDRDRGDGMPRIPEILEDVIISDGSHCLSLADIELVDIFGCSPLYPTVAISLQTLAAYRQSHRTCPHFSVQAQCKTLCHLHNIPYRAYLNMQFSVAYDVYLEILHRMKNHLNAALGQNTPNWQLLNSCLCCVYKLKGEPSLTFEWLATVDGNNSLKCWASTTYGLEPQEDSRQPRSDYWIDQVTVNGFQNEVRAHASTTSNHPRQDDWGDVPSEMEGSEFRCTERWRNAGPEQSCRHRFVLLACNMVWSGELAKYPLALLNHLMSILGENGGCAYDIGCAFAKTLASSSLGPCALALNLRMMVGAFHGHAYNRHCQLDWHPMYIDGTGHTEGEGCEHVFAFSNELARSTRHASAFHRHQTIEEHFSFWNEDKYAALSTFLRNHYREGLMSIQTLKAELAVLRDALGLTDTEWQLAREAANHALTTIAAGNLSHISAALTQARIRVDSAYTKLQNAEAFTAHIEIQLEIKERWVVGGEAYNQYKQQASQRQYRAALDELEHLVVMQLFELSKLSLSGTGYKLRQQIGKALQRRSDAIRNALNRYNVQAAALDPPRPQLSWKNITEYSFLGKFDLLRHSRTDIRELDWMKPAHREATVKYFKLCRAREEIVRLNVKICRLRTAIHDEGIQMTAVITDLLVSNPPLSRELQRQWQACAAVNAVHILQLDQLTLQPGFSGTRIIGNRIGAVATTELETDSIPRMASNDASISTEGRVAHDIITSEHADEGIIEHEEQLQLTQDIADFIVSIVDL
ncbi:hypothetical protein DFH29DRAFT_872226 [Suillus ampliporus]|nr:hypothetical protein DFH29DRAFT_872226 [Suillus ampliporus]